MKVILVIISTCLAFISAVDYCTPSQNCWPSAAEVAAFKNSMASTDARVMTPGDDDWVGPYLTFNFAYAKTPALIVFVGSEDQIREALRFAFKYNIKVSIVSSGHSFYGRCGATDSMQISVHYMKDIKIDLDCDMNELGCATLQAGVQWGEAYREADKYNRIVLGGSNPTVAVSGWTLGGGHSPLSRKFGLGIHTTLQFHLITADLSEVWARANETVIKREDGTVEKTNDTSLFYALRGGTSAFGVLVDITVKLFPASPIVQSACLYPAFIDGTPHAFDVMLKDVGEFLLTAPNTFGGYIIPSVSCDPSGKGCSASSLISIVHYGARENSPDAEWFTKLDAMAHGFSIKGLTQGGCQENKFKSFYDYEMTIPNVTYTNQYMTGSLIQERYMTEQVADEIVKNLNASYHAGRSLGITGIWVGGKSAEAPKHPSPVHRGWSDAILSFSAYTAWDPAKLPDASKWKQGARDLHSDMARFSDGVYSNEAAQDLEPIEWKKEFWGLENYRKLMAIKKVWDPENKFTCFQCLGEDWDPNSNDIFG